MNIRTGALLFLDTLSNALPENAPPEFDHYTASFRNPGTASRSTR